MSGHLLGEYALDWNAEAAGRTRSGDLVEAGLKYASRCVVFDRDPIAVQNANATTRAQ